MHSSSKTPFYAKKPNSTEWRFEANDKPVTKESWARHYPNLLDVELESVFEQLRGIYNEKKVVWSDTTKRWQYLNHKAVDFTTADKAQVTAILKSTAKTLSSLQISETSALLGTFKATPVKATPLQKTSTPKITPAPQSSVSKGKTPAIAKSQTLPPPKTQTMASSSGTTTTTNQKLLDTPPDTFDDATDQAEAFWLDLTNYYYLNEDIYSDEDRQISSALILFKRNTPAGEWAKDRQKAAFLISLPQVLEHGKRSRKISKNTSFLSTPSLSPPSKCTPLRWETSHLTHGTKNGSPTPRDRELTKKQRCLPSVKTSQQLSIIKSWPFTLPQPPLYALSNWLENLTRFGDNGK